MVKEKEKEREQAQKLKALRRELEEKLEEQLPAEFLDDKLRVEVQRAGEGEELDDARARQIVEALLFASSRPLTAAEIRKVIKSLTPGKIAQFVSELREEYAQHGRSFEILEIASGYEIATKKEFAPWIMKVELQKKAKQVTQSALETLSILAYKQPITRAEIEELRGVDVSAVLATLVERGLIKIVGKKEVPGRPFLYGTTDKFLEHFGLKSLQDLPSIDEIRNLVENSVKKEELIGTRKMVDVPQEEAAGDGAQAAEEAAEEAAAAEDAVHQEPQENEEEPGRTAQEN